MDRNLTPPVISVILSVYNGEKFLKEAITSILEQTFTNFELIIVNDASTDNSISIINSLHDRRLKIINNKTNLGLTKSLNKALRFSKGKYIARMDADDISLPERLQKQYDFLEAHPEIGICGANYQFIGGKTSDFPCNHELLRIKLFQGKNLIAHPSVMIRKEFLLTYNIQYNESIKYAQDFKLWVDASKNFKITNLPDVLLKYRIHNQQITENRKNEQRKYVEKICLEQLEEFVQGTSSFEKALHLQFINEVPVIHLENLYEIQKWAENLININRINHIFNEELFKQEITMSLKRIKGNFFAQHYLKVNSYSLKILLPYYSNKFKAYQCFSARVNLLFFVKCLIFYKKKTNGHLLLSA